MRYYCEGRRFAWMVGLSGLMPFGCADTNRNPHEWMPSAGTLTESEGAHAVVERIRTRFVRTERSRKETALQPRSDSLPVLGPSAAERIDVDGAWLRPHLPDALVHRHPQRAAVALPSRASGPFQLRDEQSGMTVEVALAGATDATAEIADGFVVYRRGHQSSADIVHRPAGDGTEDYLSFEHAPGVEALQYELSLGERVAGLRLVSHTLELLDAGGAPRLRMSPPYVVDAAGERHEANVALQGCAYDTDPAAPWGRPVVAPRARQCKVHVGWERAGVRYPALVDPAWVATGSMATARARHTATALPSGRVLVAGGYGDAHATLTSAELYDPATGTWSATGTMASPRFNHTASVLPTSRILVAGGEHVQLCTASAEVYDPVTGTWTHTGSMATERFVHTASVLPDGKILVAGGIKKFGWTQEVFNSAEVYDPATGTWSYTGSMVAKRGRHTASVLPDGKVLVAGCCYGTVSTSAEVYDPATGTWTNTGSMVVDRGDHVASVLPDGKVLVAGGYWQPLRKTAEVYDPATNTWTATGDMTAGRESFTASVLSNGHILVVGGEDEMAGAKNAEIYDPTTGAWSDAGSLSVRRGEHTASVLPNGDVLVAGGWEELLTPLASAELFKWIQYENGLSCTLSSDCISGFCVDGVCCDAACGGNLPDDCLACSIPAGTLQDGMCGPLTGSVCNADACNVAGTCQAGVCTGLTPVPCTAQDECHEAGTCDALTGCSNPEKPDGTSCPGGVCTAGVCGPDPSMTGSSGASGGTGATSGAGGETGGSTLGGDVKEFGGCGCRASRDASASGFGVVVLALLLLRRRSQG